MIETELEGEYLMGRETFIHPLAVVEPGCSLGSGNWIGPFAVIGGNVALGDDNWIGPSSVIGSPSQHRGYVSEAFEWLVPHLKYSEYSTHNVVIGSRNVVREFCTIQAPTSNSLTRVGDDNYFMTQAHIPHDCVVGDHVTLANSVQIGGHSVLHSYCTVGLGSDLHQYSIVGPYAMLGMGSVVKGVVPPFALMSGNPARLRRANSFERFADSLDPQDQVILRRLFDSSESDPASLLESIRSESMKGSLLNKELRGFFESVEI